MLVFNLSDFELLYFYPYFHRKIGSSRHQRIRPFQVSAMTLPILKAVFQIWNLRQKPFMMIQQRFTTSGNFLKDLNCLNASLVEHVSLKTF